MPDDSSALPQLDLRVSAVQTSPPVVLLENLTKRYQQGANWSNALSRVSLSVSKGTIQGIIGFSGAGKTTLSGYENSAISATQDSEPKLIRMALTEGMRRPAPAGCVKLPVIDALEARETRRPTMKQLTNTMKQLTNTMKQLTNTMMQKTLNKHDRRLTVGLDLGDRSSFYCVLQDHRPDPASLSFESPNEV